MNRKKLATLVAAPLALGLLSAGAALTAPAAHAASSSFTQHENAVIGASSDVQSGGFVNITDYAQNPIDVAYPYPSVSGQFDDLAGPITKVTVRINNFRHEFPRDVDMLLVGPDGQRSLLMSDVGGTAQVNNVSMTFDDSSTTYLNANDTFGTGTFHTSNASDADYFPNLPAAVGAPTSLSAMNGTDGRGLWSLYVVDDTNVYAGAFDSWTLSVWTKGTTYPSTVTVANVQGAITDVDVKLTMSHNRFSDLDMLLVGPRGQQVTLASDAGGLTEVDAGDLVFDDAAATGVQDPVRYTAYRPTDVVEAKPDSYPAPAPAPDGNTLLSAFNGTNPNGDWRLFIVDDATDADGYVDHWTLDITTTDPPAPGQSPTPTTGGGGGGGTDQSAPRVAATRPGSSTEAVRRGVDVTATFTEAVRPGTVTRTTAYVVRKGSARHLAATVTYRPATKQVVIDPTKRLRGGTTYTAVITTAVRDRAGNRLDQNPVRAGLQPKTWRFTTR